MNPVGVKKASSKARDKIFLIAKIQYVLVKLSRTVFV